MARTTPGGAWTTEPRHDRHGRPGGPPRDRPGPRRGGDAPRAARLRAGPARPARRGARHAVGAPARTARGPAPEGLPARCGRQVAHAGHRHRAAAVAALRPGPERPGCWPLALAEEPGVPSAGATLDWLGLPPVRDMERASHLRFVFDDPVSASRTGRAGRPRAAAPARVVGRGRLRVRVHRRPPPTSRDSASRRWRSGIGPAQVQHLSSLQWDALAGLPSVNWLVLLGPAFLAQAGLSIEALADAVEPRARSGIYARQGLHGLALAAGPRPSPVTSTARTTSPRTRSSTACWRRSGSPRTGR